ncbi:MAG: tyrosine-type recombinase/integrase [Flavobacteriaceae bacterium]|nr:tyrosine-type recombinase/integrase [Flavobacteriaceae bacterium]
MPVQQFIDYLSLEKKYSLHTVKAYNDDLHSFQDFCFEQFENDNLIAVNYSQIRSWIVALVDQGRSNRTINRKISSLKAFYKFLLKSKQIDENPLVKHKALKVAKRLQVPFSKDELEHVFEHLNENTDFEGFRNRLMVELFYSTGIRRAELIELKLNDVDLANETIKVLGKRNKERYIPLLKSVQETLGQYIELRRSINHDNNGYLLLTKKGKKVYGTLVYRVINTYFSKVSSKVKKSPHVIRHSFATHLLNEGADLNSVKELLGHSSLASTQVYTNNSLSELKKVYNRAHPRSSKN